MTVAIVVAGCAEPTIDEEEAAGYVDQWSSSVEEFLYLKATRAAASEALTRRMQAASRSEESRSDGPPFYRLVDEVYQAREYQPVLVNDEGLTAHGEAIWEAMQTLEEHRLDSEPYQLEAISEALEKWQEQAGSISDFDALAATEKEEQEARDWLVEQPVSEFALIEDNYPTLTTTLVEHDNYGQRLRDAQKQYQEKRAGLTETAAEIEHRLATALVRYARDQRHFRVKEIFVHPRHWDFYNEPDVENSGRRPDPARGGYLAGQIWRDAAHLTEEIAEEKGAILLHEKIAETLADVLDSEDPKGAVAAIPPQQPQYSGLVAEYRRYKEIVENGGWEEVSRRDNLREGSTHARIGELKRRLLAEGYFPADVEIDDTFDEDLTEAIRSYQQTHQMQVSGRPHHVFWFSLNISAEHRLAQIGLNIERWRETNIQHELPTYTFVNIPDFSVEVWHGQERVQRNATIVGDNQKSVNPLTAESEYSNRTPTPMAAYIDRVIFNPYWNVTDRIRAVRILPEVRKSLEEKYVLQLYELHQQVTGSDESAARSSTRSAEVASVGGVAGAERAESDSEEESEVAASSASPFRQMTDEEREEARQKARAEKRERAMNTLTEMRRVEVRVEGSDRMESRRFFKLPEIERIKAGLHGDDEEARERFRNRFTYIDWETGEVDVENTDLDDVPSWYEANGYDVVRHGNWEYVRMLPGPENALGGVKIIFPNYDNIYLHDTPAKELFNRDVRGFSHGCIRVQDPMKLSEVLLELGGIEGTNINQILADEDYLPIFLERQIPVFLEYYTVRVDDDGRANFLADIYGYDAEILSDDT